MKLVLAEKPSVAREIARVLNCKKEHHGVIEGKEYVVTWALGHLVTLADPDHYNPIYKTWRLEDLPIVPKYLKKVVIKNTRKQFNFVKEAMLRKDIDEIIIATDAGREGELVARWILDKVRPDKKIKRLWISSVTDRAIRNGFSNLKTEKETRNLYHAAIARSESDWLIGINATRALTTKYNAQLSCGRVQTPTLAMIASRDEKIRNFQPEAFYTLQAYCQGLKFTASQRFKNKDIKIDSSKFKVIKIDSKEKKVCPKAIYDLTLLQREAFNAYKMSPKQTLSVMQKLYEHHKIVTYPRTDSNYLTSDMFEGLPDVLKAIQIKPYQKYAFKLIKEGISHKRFINDKKVTDHHGIIPTEEAAVIQDLSRDERRIYEMIVKRFIENLMDYALYKETKVTIEVDGHQLLYKHLNIIKPGFKVLSEEHDSKVVDFTNLSLDQIKFEKNFTQAPAHFNEGTLLAAMENPSQFMNDQDMKKVLQNTGGLGTVATRADIIEKLFSTQVIESKGHDIHITHKGKQLLDLVPKALKTPKLTGEWEQRLDAISKGREDYKAFINEMKNYTQTIIKDIKESDHKFKHDNLSSKKCPKCGQLMLIVENKHGKSYVCQDKSCNERISISKTTNARCPECHKKLELRGSEKKIFYCKCGYRESLEHFNERKKKKSGGKRDYINYMKKQEKEAPKGNSAFSKLQNLNLKK